MLNRQSGLFAVLTGLVLVGRFAIAAEPRWVAHYGEDGDAATAVAVDGEGRIYVLGPSDENGPVSISRFQPSSNSRDELWYYSFDDEDAEAVGFVLGDSANVEIAYVTVRDIGDANLFI